MTIGFVGIGTMGSRIAGRLLRHGHQVSVYDTSAEMCTRLREAGAYVCKSAQEVGDRAETVFLCLPTPAIARQSALGDGGVGSGMTVKFVVDFSTIGPQAAGEIAEGLATVGKTYVDAPVSGGVLGAEKGTLAIMVACKAEVLEILRPALESLGKVFHVGATAGQGQAVKLANNLLSMTALAISSEALVMGAAVGIDPRVMLDAINAGSGRNTATMEKFPRAILTGTFDFGFSTGLAYKDVKLCVEEAEKLGVPMFVGSAVRELYHVTQSTQGAQSDFTSVCKVIEAWARTEVRAR